MIRCIVIDDEPFALAQMAKYVEKTPQLQLLDSFNSPIDAFGFLQQNKVDLVFVDIEMPDLNGVELVRSLTNSVKVIFTTAYRDYALEGFAVDAADYLLKPIDYAAFLRSVSKVIDRYFSRDHEFVFVKSKGQLLKVKLSEVLYIEAKREYVSIVTDNGIVSTLTPVKSMEEQLPSQSFMRVHRSFIVNLNRIEAVERNRIVFGKLYIPIGDQYLERFKNFIRNSTYRSS